MVAAERRSVPAPPAGLSLVLGGSRSGKSAWAEAMALAHHGPVYYLATAASRPNDPAWQQRLALHQQRRPDHWLCVETGPDLAGALQAIRLEAVHDPRPLLLVDALGTWLAQHLEDPEPRWQQRQAELLEALLAWESPVLLVAEEVGLGVVPPTAIGGLFRDRMGACQQALMQQASGSWLVVAGRAIDLQTIGQPVPRC